MIPFPFPSAAVVSFQTDRGWRAGIHVRAHSDEQAAEFIATSNYFKPVRPTWL